MEIYEVQLENTTSEAFALVNISNKTFVCPSWVEVPVGTLREQIKISIKTPIPKKEVKVKKSPKKEWRVNGSKDNIYTVSVSGGEWNCTCPAKSFRRGDCKHIKGIKETL